MSESLKQKAKTLVELSRMFEQEKVTFRPHESDERHEQRIKKLGAELWIRLEDADKVIEEYGKDNEALAKTLSTFNDEIVLLKSKLQERKHKLHQILDELSIWTPEKIEHHLSAFLNKDLRDLCWRTEQFVRVVDLQKKFEELLENE